MHFNGSRGHPKFNLDGGLPRGPATILKAAVDPVKVPTEPSIVAVIQRCLCKVEMGEDCWVVKGMTGDVETVSYNDPITRWVEVCERLLKKALDSRSL